MDLAKGKKTGALLYLSAGLVAVLCLPAISACSGIPNAHPHNAVPLPIMTVKSSYGPSSASFIYKHQDYVPAEADSIIKSREPKENSAQTPLSYTIGIGRNWAVGAQTAVFLGPAFKSSSYYPYMSDVPSIKPSISVSYYTKIHLQKNIPLGSDFYLAVFPAYGTGAGVEWRVIKSKLRYDYKSFELPVTLSKRFRFAGGRQLVISGTARTAWDQVSSDLSMIESGHLSFIFHYYYDQPRLYVFRKALIGHLDYYLDNSMFLMMQFGMEHLKVKERESWEPIIFLGGGMKISLPDP